MVVLLIGQQGTGKTTLGQGLLDDSSVERFVSGGVLIRREIHLRTEIGKRIKKPIDAGDRIPPELMYEMLAAELDGCRPDPLLLDGFPGAAAEHPELVEVAGTPDLVLLLGGVPQDQLVQRIEDRRECEVCYRTRTGGEGIRCDCGGRLRGRPEDSALDRISKRHGYWATCERDLVDLYDGLGALVRLDAREPPDQLRTSAGREIRASVKTRR